MNLRLPRHWRKKRWQAVRCAVGLHDWENHQELFVRDNVGVVTADVVIAWDQCRCCAKSKLVHILK